MRKFSYIPYSTFKKNDNYLNILLAAYGSSLSHSFIIPIFENHPKTYGTGTLKSSCSLNLHISLSHVGQISLQLGLRLAQELQQDINTYKPIPNRIFHN